MRMKPIPQLPVDMYLSVQSIPINKNLSPDVSTRINDIYILSILIQSRVLRTYFAFFGKCYYSLIFDYNKV